jgi:hypothetical protein
MADLILPQVVPEVQQGYALGQQQLANKSLGNYIASGGKDQQSLNTAAQINPQAALSTQGTLTQQTQQKAVNMAKFIQSAPDQFKDQAYQQVKPFLAGLGVSQVPEHYDDSVAQAVQGIVNAYTPTNQVPAAVKTAQYFQKDLTPEEKDKANRVHLGLDPRASNPSYTQIEVPDGQGGKIQAFYNKQTSKVESADYSGLTGQPASTTGPTTPGGLPIANDNMAPYIQEANRRVQSGEDPNVVQAWLQGIASQQKPSGAPSAGLGITPAKEDKDKAPSGYRFTGGGNLEPIPGGPADKGGTAAQIGDATLTGQDFLKSVQDPGMQHMIQAIAEGRMAVPKIYRASKGGEIGASEIAQAVNSYDPSFDAVNYNARQGTLKGFTSGKEAQTVNALNTVAEHLGTLSDYADALNNTSYPAINSLANTYLKQTGDPRIARFDTAKKAAADEVAKVWRATGGSEADVQENLKNLDGAQSPEQLHAAIGTLVQLIGGKLAALNDQYSSGMGTAANRHSIVSPEANAAFQKVLNRAGMTANGIGTQAARPPAQAAPSQPQQDLSHFWGG